MEALAAGVPLVVRELPVLREVFGSAARFAATPEDLAAALGAAVSDDDPYGARRAGNSPPATPGPRPRAATWRSTARRAELRGARAGGARTSSPTHVAQNIDHCRHYA
ncbi:hypothetical protein [Streptomyces albicerus]|uniref:hypothetical protein n=1 Tax=Streptomyces albicerus TaxID=2569859 RepID=UPI00384CACC5